MAINVPLNAQLQNATQLQQQIQNAVNSVQLNLGGGAGGSRALNSLSQPLGRLTGQADEFTKSLDAANARVLAFGASVGVLNTLAGAFKALVQSTINVEKTLTDINVVFGKSTSEIKNFGKELFTVAKDTGQSFEEVSKAALEFSRQGKTVEETLARTKDALILTRLTGLDTARAVEGLTATINSFSKEALTSSEIINKLAAVDQKFAVSAADLTEALSRSASVAQNAGVGFEELIGIVAALQEKTARGGAVIGNSLKTIFTRVRESDTLKELNRLGVAVEDINTNKLLTASQILKNLAGNAKALGEVQRSDIFKDVGGGFQINQLIALLDDYSSAQSKAAEAQGVATGATNQAYLANEKLNQTIAALINNSVEGLKELGATLGDLGISDSIKNALGVVNSFIESVQGLMEGEGAGAKLAQGIVKGIGSVLSGPGLALFGVVITKLIFDLGKFAIQGLKTFLGIGKAASEQKALQEAIVITLSRNAALQAQIGKFQGNAVAQASVLAGIYNQQEASLRRQNAIAAGMSSVLFRQGMRAGPQGFTQTGRAAGGYLPSAEAADVSRGVGGASPSSQVVSIPNFAFGNGQRGTMIANTSEYIVPNYANGGSAIFNQDMVSSMGLPAGAQKIRAAGGYIPNFAEAGAKKEQLKIDAKKDLGGIGMITIGGNPTGREKASYPFDIASSNAKVKDFPILAGTKYEPNEPVLVTNMVGSRALNALGNEGEEARQKGFSNLLFNAISPGITSVADKIFSEQLDSVKVGSVKLPTSGKLSPSVEGSIFQEIVSLAVDSFTESPNIKKAAFQGEDNRAFDYEINGPALPELGKLFFDGLPIFKADAKRTDGKDSRPSMVKKIFNDARVFGKLLSNREDIRKEIGNKEMTFNRGTAFKAEKLTSDQLVKRVQDAEAAEMEASKRASKGYIPNFANQALTDSINRERVQSGLPISAISVTQDNRLTNNRNPMGLAVINSRDEPNGKIPNFAAPQPLTAADFGNASKALGTNLDDLNKKIKELASQVSKGTKTEIEAKAALDAHIAGLKNFSAKNPNSTLANSKSLANIQTVAGGQLSNSVQTKTEKGFGDLVGKIFLFQTALSFATGAAGDLESSTAKLAAKLSETATNVASFGLLGQQLMESNPASALGKFGKNLGLVGLGAGVLYEGFKLADFAIKEFSGENAKVASSLAKLNDASKLLAIKFEDLSGSRQVDLKTQASEILGSSGFEGLWNGLANFLRDKKIGGGDVGGNTDVQMGVAKLLAVGASLEDVQKILIEARPKDRMEASISDVLKALEVASSSGVGKNLSQKYQSYQVSTAGLDMSDQKNQEQAKQKAAEAYGVTDFSKLNKNQQELIKADIENRKFTKKLADDEAKVQNAINLGKRIAVDIAKQEIDSAIELKRLSLEKTSDAEYEIKYKIATLKLSEQEKIIYDSKLKDLESQKKLQSEILEITKGGLDKALEANSINVDLKALEKMRDLLVKIDLSKIDFNKIDFKKPLEDQSNALYKLENELMAVGNISRDQAKTIIESLGQQASAKQKLFEKQGIINAAETDHLLKINNTNQALQSQLSIIDRIAQKAQSIANLNISIVDTKIAGKEARITKIDALMGGSSVTPGERENFEREKNALQQEINGLKKEKETESLTSKNSNVRGEIAKKRKELNELLERTGDGPNADEMSMGADANNDENIRRIAQLRGEIANHNRELLVNKNAYDSTNTAIDANTEALAIQEKQIGQVTGAYASLIKQLYEFRKGAGERIASANMGLLSATDPNALANSTIQRQVEMEAQDPTKNLSNEEYYKLIQTETPIRQKQFELSVETSRVRRTELENEIELMKEIAAISAATDEERLAKIKAIVDKRNEEAQSFGAGFERGVGTLKDKTQKFRSEIGEQIPQLFSDNLAQGLNDAISGAKSLKEALTDAATSFFDAITKRNIENLADTFSDGLASLFPGRKKKSDTEFRAGGGMIRGGSGTKDDVPAMLMGGEYVVKKSAVKKYGSNFLDSLNQGRLSGYATGGAVQSGAGGFYVPGEYGQGSITGQRQLLEFATQSTTSGQFDQMGSYGMSGASINLESESGRLTMAGRENSPIFERTQQTKEEAFQVYLRSLKVDEDYKNQLTEMKEAEKARKKQLIMSIGKAVASAALSAGAEVAKIGAENAIALGNEAAGKSLTGLSKLMTGAGGALQNLGALVPGGRKATLELNDAAKAQRMNNDYKSGVYTPIANREVRGAPTNYGEYVFDSYTGNYVDNTPRGARFASGGPVFGGSGNRDDVPAMLTGGEFVLNNRATKKLGMSNLQRLNSGDTSSQQDPEKGSSDLMQALISKLDELISATTQSSGDNVVVNVSGMDNKGEKNDGQQSANEKDLHRKIKAAVLEVITQEKRLGGSLNK